MDRKITRPSGGARTALQTERLRIIEVLHFHQYAIPELLYQKLAHLYGKRTSRVNDFVAQTYGLNLKES